MSELSPPAGAELEEPKAEPQGDAPPKRGRGRPPGSKTKTRSDRPPRRPAPKAAKLDQQLAELITVVGMSVGIRDDTCGLAIVDGAPRLAKALDELAKENDAVRRVLEGLVTTSTWGQVVFAVAAIAVPIAQHHNLLPDSVTELTATMTAGAPDPAANGAAAA